MLSYCRLSIFGLFQHFMNAGYAHIIILSFSHLFLHSYYYTPHFRGNYTIITTRDDFELLITTRDDLG